MPVFLLVRAGEDRDAGAANGEDDEEEEGAEVGAGGDAAVVSVLKWVVGKGGAPRDAGGAVPSGRGAPV